jgi:hypothetical protein
MGSSLRFVAFLCVCLGLGCGASSPEPKQHPEPHFTPTGPWTTMSHDQKLAYMKSYVLPTEQGLFSTFDSARYGTFDCKSCHGRGADDGSYRMPNPDLPKVAGGSEYYRVLAAKDPKMLSFMSKTVVPETAKVLGVQPFDMESHTGFSCYQRHTKK